MIKDDYEICSTTLALFPISEQFTKILEHDQEIFVQKSVLEIIDHSCRFFGSTYLGRYEGTKSLLGFNYKLPIIIEESRDLIFFPTHSPSNNECIWISLNLIETYRKHGKKVDIIFKGGNIVELPISYYSMENQILRATRLLMILNRRKM